MTGRHSDFWGKRRVRILRQRWQRTPIADIAKELGAVSNKAVIGKARRLGLPPRRVSYVVRASGTELDP